MSKPVKPARATWLSPYLAVNDVKTAADFYQKAFQFEILELAPGPDGSVYHGEMRYKDQLIMIGKAGAYGETVKAPKQSGVESPIQLYIYCEDVDQFHKHAVAAGAISERAPEDTFWGDRMCNLKDPDGYVWCFATHLGEEADQTAKK